MTGHANEWTGVCNQCCERVTVLVVSKTGKPLPADLDPDLFVCGECRDPRQQGQQLELANPEPDVFGRGRVETTEYPPDMIRIPY